MKMAEQKYRKVMGITGTRTKSQDKKKEDKPLKGIRKKIIEEAVSPKRKRSPMMRTTTTYLYNGNLEHKLIK